MTDTLDTLGMFDAAAALPEQIEQAVTNLHDAAVELPPHDDIENVVVLGMGASALAGEMIREIAGPFMPVPVVVHKGYGIPNFIGEGTLVFAVSFSGDAEETVEAAAEAVIAGGRLIVITGGGELGRLASEWGVARLPVADGIPAPRAAVGALAVPPLLMLERMGLFPGATAWIGAAVSQLRKRRDELLVDDNPAATLARRIGRQLPIVYGGGGLGGLAAERWKTGFNENAKVPAFWNQLPELSHNEVCGWGQHGDVTRQVFRLIDLRHDYEHPQVMRRFEVVDDLVDEVVAEIEHVRAEGDGPLAQLFDLILLGDFTSLHLAVQSGVDPGPTPTLVDIEARLSVR